MSLPHWGWFFLAGLIGGYPAVLGFIAGVYFQAKLDPAPNS